MPKQILGGPKELLSILGRNDVKRLTIVENKKGGAKLKARGSKYLYTYVAGKKDYSKISASVRKEMKTLGLEVKTIEKKQIPSRK